MSYKLFWLLGSFLLLLAIVVYMIMNPSYEKSFEAKYFYSLGRYDKSLSLAKEAFALNNYNRMASTIMAQSKIALEYKQYIQQAKTYLSEINLLVRKEDISDADKARMRMMSQIVIQGYIKISPSVVTDKNLVKEAAHYRDEFVKIHEKISSSI